MAIQMALIICQSVTTAHTYTAHLCPAPPDHLPPALPPSLPPPALPPSLPLPARPPSLLVPSLPVPSLPMPSLPLPSPLPSLSLPLPLPTCSSPIHLSRSSGCPEQLQVLVKIAALFFWSRAGPVCRCRRPHARGGWFGANDIVLI